jgi:hypothetical protein
VRARIEFGHGRLESPLHDLKIEQGDADGYKAGSDPSYPADLLAQQHFRQQRFYKIAGRGSCPNRIRAWQARKPAPQFKN